ncbi:MAG: hypothetical protein RLZZ282_1034, partial [Verrucomicrobiota bacterium]
MLPLGRCQAPGWNAPSARNALAKNGRISDRPKRRALAMCEIWRSCLRAPSQNPTGHPPLRARCLRCRAAPVRSTLRQAHPGRRAFIASRKSSSSPKCRRISPASNNPSGVLSMRRPNRRVSALILIPNSACEGSLSVVPRRRRGAHACCFRCPRRKLAASAGHGRTRISSARAPKTTREGACAPQCGQDA